MVAARNLRRWYWIHKWSSLVCTAFLLVICISGLPLVFMEEINDAILPAREAAPRQPGDVSAADIDQMIVTARSRFPGHAITYVSLDDDEPTAFIGLVPSFALAKRDPRLNHWIKFDTRTGAVINTSEQFERDVSAAPYASLLRATMNVMIGLHVDWFAKLPGQLFLSLMALLFVAAIISGMVLYGPFMKKLPFGTVRQGKSTRLRWLDLHNMLGIVAMAWTAIVGLTGAINEIARPLNDLWNGGDVRAAWAPWQGSDVPAQSSMTSVQAAFDKARHALPGMEVSYLAFPNPDSGSAYHYLLWANGSVAVTRRLSTAIMIDAMTGEVTKVLEMPWYLRILELSRPLHFGDYGGLPLKILWALFDVITIAVLGSGIYLWFARSMNERERRRAASHDCL